MSKKYRKQHPNHSDNIKQKENVSDEEKMDNLYHEVRLLIKQNANIFECDKNCTCYITKDGNPITCEVCWNKVLQKERNQWKCECGRWVFNRMQCLSCDDADSITSINNYSVVRDEDLISEVYERELNDNRRTHEFYIEDSRISYEFDGSKVSNERCKYQDEVNLDSKIVLCDSDSSNQSNSSMYREHDTIFSNNSDIDGNVTLDMRDKYSEFTELTDKNEFLSALKKTIKYKTTEEKNQAQINELEASGIDIRKYKGRLLNVLWKLNRDCQGVLKINHVEMINKMLESINTQVLRSYNILNVDNEEIQSAKSICRRKLCTIAINDAYNVLFALIPNTKQCTRRFLLYMTILHLLKLTFENESLKSDQK